MTNFHAQMTSLEIFRSAVSQSNNMILRSQLLLAIVIHKSKNVHVAVVPTQSQNKISWVVNVIELTMELLEISNSLQIVAFVFLQKVTIVNAAFHNI